MTVRNQCHQLYHTAWAFQQREMYIGTQIYCNYYRYNVIIPWCLLWLVEKGSYLLQLQTGAQDVRGFQFLLNIVKLVDEHFWGAQIVCLCTKVKDTKVLHNTIASLTSILYACMYSLGVVASFLWNISVAGSSILSARSRWILAEFSMLSTTSKCVPRTIKPSPNCPVSFKCSPTLSSCNKRLCNYINTIWHNVTLWSS